MRSKNCILWAVLLPVIFSSLAAACVPNQKGCATCNTNHGTCQGCMIGYALSYRGTCDACPLGCRTCDYLAFGIQCGECKSDYKTYTHTNGIIQCYRCLQNCLKCSTPNTCEICTTEFNISADKKSCNRISGSTTAPAESSPQSSGISAAAVLVLIILGVLLLVGLIVGLYFCCKKTKAQQKKQVSAGPDFSSLNTLTIPHNTFALSSSSNNTPSGYIFDQTPMNATTSRDPGPGFVLPNRFQYPAYPVPIAQFHPVMTNSTPVTQPNIAEKAPPNIIEINLPRPYQPPLDAKAGF